MPSGTKFRPTTYLDFSSDYLRFNSQGVSTTGIAGTTFNLDLAFTDDHLISGAWFIVSNGNQGDTCDFQIIDTTGAFTGTAGTVLNQFITNWLVPPTVDEQLDIIYPAKILAGMSLRLVYTSTGTSNPFVALNYKLHKVLS